MRSIPMRELVYVPSPNPDDARRRELLNILVLGVAGAVVLGLLAVEVAGALRIADSSETLLLVYGGVAALLGFLVIFLINRYWSGIAASVLFLLLTTGVLAVSDVPEEVVNGRALFTFAIPILVASVLLRPWASFATAGLVSVVITGLALSIGFVPPVPTLLGFFAIALVAWLAARSLENALQQVRTVNRELDQRVAERTHDLAEALAREHAAANRNRAILESIADGVIVFDNEGRAIIANSAIARLIEQPVERVIGQDIEGLLGRDLDRMDREVIQHLMTDATTRYPSLKIRWRDKTLSVSFAHVQGSSGESIGSVAVFRDFTREAELDRMKNDFISIASHELRTPLTSVRGYLDLLAMSAGVSLDAQQYSFLQVARDNANRLTQLVNDLLDVSRIESGKIELEVEVLSVQDVVREAAALVEKQFSDRGLTLTLDLPASLPQVFADRSRLAQIVTNLLTNACKYTQRGGATVRARRIRNTIQVDVIDTGIGISQEDQDRLFTRFFRADDPQVREQPGTGLGLSITKALIEMHGGQIWVRSQYGQGSTFSFTLPLPPGAMVEHPAPERAALAEALVAAGDQQGRHPLVMIVDDDPDVAHMFQNQLMREGYRVTVVTEGSQVLPQARELRPDLITLDLVMEVDGLAVLKDLKADPATASIPVLIVSVVRQRDQGLALGAADYLVKPVAEEELQDAVHRILGEPTGAAQHRILVVDDDPDILGWLKIELSQAGYQVVTANDGVEALQEVARTVPDLILLDLAMPRMDGRTTLRRLRERRRSRDIPVIVLTAVQISNETERAAILDLGVRELLHKPVSFSDLAAEVKKCLVR
jgi:PAS domain S-box-containing protein